jgi:hypothetical protein
MTEGTIYYAGRGNVLRSWIRHQGCPPVHRQERDEGTPFYVCQNIVCHDSRCLTQSFNCALALATNMVRAGFADGTLITPCRFYHEFESIRRMEEWQRSPRLSRWNDGVNVMRRWIRDSGDNGIKLEYMASKPPFGMRFRRDYYVSLADDAARFTFYVMWHGSDQTIPRIRWPDDWQLQDQRDGAHHRREQAL